MNQSAAIQSTIAEGLDIVNPAPAQQIPHISVCVCTYKRAIPLKRLIADLNVQDTGGLFTYSIVVADNDQEQSARSTIEELRLNAAVPLIYCVESRRGIARARNKVIENAEGEFIAFIDDDEFPAPGWLLTLFKTCIQYKVDGVLGPVKRHFDEAPPKWLQKSSLYERRVNPTGMRVDCRESRTGNVLLHRRIFAGDATPFRPEIRSGSDDDFFRRKTAEGLVFIWSAEAVVFEVIPPARWKRMYCVRKALLQGACATLKPSLGTANIVKSMIAVPLYTLALPVALVLGQQHFMTLLLKMCHHLGKLLALAGIQVVREAYVSD
jgi:glycosyltransferase involved in cell wall biosynthesis